MLTVGFHRENLDNKIGKKVENFKSGRWEVMTNKVRE